MFDIPNAGASGVQACFSVAYTGPFRKHHSSLKATRAAKVTLDLLKVRQPHYSRCLQAKGWSMYGKRLADPQGHMITAALCVGPATSETAILI